MDVVWTLIRENTLPEYGWIQTGRQTRGRGRLNREWVSEQGSLMVSIRLPDIAGKLEGLLSPALALPLVACLTDLGVPARIKWPNDIMVGRRKVGGILIEQKGRFTVAGIGMNLAAAPETSREESFFQIQAGCLEDYGIKLKPAPLWTLLSERIRHQLPVLISDPHRAVEHIQGVLAFKGETVILHHTGICDGPAQILGIDTRGCLVVRTLSGKFFISSGSVSLRVFNAVEIDEARKTVQELGLPVMLKAEGGGRGIYEIFDMNQLETAFSKASTLAQAAFGNPRIYVEKLLTSVRHIEIQVIADHYGNVFAFDERDCTVHRNHQKLVEITPSPWPKMTEQLRKRLKDYAKALVSEVGYYSLATVEFLVETDGTPYLIEVNTRLQVEHGITECRYGIDLVEEQIAVAFGSRLRFTEKKTKPVAHAIQVRINCEDPRHNFAPNAGHISRYISPGGPGVRLDSCIAGGYEFPSNYDSAASLLIAHGETWDKALAVMNRALKEYVIGGVKTTIPFHQKIISDPVFQSGLYDTRFIENRPGLMRYRDNESKALRLSRLMAEISAMGHNPHIQLSDYRGVDDKRVGSFEPVCAAHIQTDPGPVHQSSGL